MSVYSEIKYEKVPAFSMARYVIISPQPENDANRYMDEWMKNAGLEDCMKIGWDFPFVSQEQKEKFGLRGYVAACVLPNDFRQNVEGVEYASQEAALYAVMTITDPFVNPFERIPGAYQEILKKVKVDMDDNYLTCLEHIYEKDTITYMDIYVHAKEKND